MGKIDLFFLKVQAKFFKKMLTSKWLVNKAKLLSISFISMLVMPVATVAATITYTSTSLGLDRFQYNYFVSAQPGDETINEFTIYFNQSAATNLSIVSTPPTFDSLIIQPDISLLSDGFLDIIATGQGISVGTSVGPFSVAFDQLSGSIQPQIFEIINPTDFTVVSSGVITSAGPVLPPIIPPITNVPEPQSIALYLLGMTLIWFTRKRFS